MDDATSAMAMAQKRPHEEDHGPSTPVKAIGSNVSTPLSELSVQTPSPLQDRALSCTATAKTNANTNPPSSTTHSAKRRKLTPQEKEEQRLEKEAKTRAREDKKVQKEAEDKLKVEQRAQREEEKRKKAEERDEKKRKREEELQQKEEERLKKERSQMKLNAFFAKPKDTGNNVGQAVAESVQAPSLSLLPDRTGAATNSVPSSPQKIVKNGQTDYDRYFLPFNIPANTILAPRNALLEDPAGLEAARTRLDKLITSGTTPNDSITRQTLPFKSSLQHCRGFKTVAISEIIERFNGSSDHPLDLTADANTNSRQPLDMLTDIPMKYIHFQEDVRPPYYGTYTKQYTDAESRRLARNPVSRVRKDTQYDYDSEAEWEEPEEGEDLDSDGEDDGDDDGDDDMDGFLDDEEDAQLKRGLISGDLVPVSTGLCWEDSNHVSRLNDGSGAICTDFREFAIEVLFEQQPVSIDPFSTAYWLSEPPQPTSAISTTNKGLTSIGPMNPPRAPLAQRTMNGLLNTLNTPIMPTASTTAKPAKAKRMIPSDQLSAFKAEIDGKDLTKLGMIEALKKAFPKLPKDAISNTLSVVAARVGPTEKEKRWVLINT